MINLSLLYEQVQPILESIVNVPVIIQDQEGEEPADNYIAFKFKDWQKIGSSSSEHLGGTSTLFKTYTLHRCTLNFLAIGNDANQLLLEVAHRIQKETTRFSLRQYGLNYLNQDSIKPSPKVLSTGWEQRYMLDVNFNIKVEDADDLNYVEFVEITTKISDPSGNQVYEETQVIDIVP